ncbi:MAG TPA: DUF2848 domain-containing protein [Stellaceae bacterium]|nr:DUF2848 domain-containing protein [Stellaceae bacterium]
MSPSEHSLSFTIRRGERAARETIAIRHAVIAGWTGRDQAALEKHIRELEALGVARPATTPIFYRVAASRLTTAAAIEAAGDESSGEVEFILLRHGGALYLGVGSDHTDRKVEAYNVTVSKQMCEKPVAPELWALDDVVAHWDRLILRSWIVRGAEKTLYQEGSVAAMRAPQELIALYAGADGFGDGTLMFCGTLAAKGGVRPAPRFAFEIEDPVRDRRIAHGYDVISLPILG